MADNQPRDDHAKQLKQTVSSVKQLRGWMASDPSRTEEFVDTLNRATGLRLLSRAWAEAAPEAAEAVSAADKLVRSRGPVGPYTPVVDAARYFTALVHVATVQLGMGLSEPAGMTIGAAMGWKDQLTAHGMAQQLAPRTAVWALLADAHSGLAHGDLARANAMADSALGLARGSDLDDAETVVLLEALRSVAHARSSVGLVDQAVDLLREAVEIWNEWTHEDLAQLPRMAKPHLERMVAPAFAIHRELVAALWQLGRGDEALEVAEQWGTLMHRSAARRGEPGRVDLALARSDQAWLLADAGRAAESLRTGEAAQQALNALLKSEKPVGKHLATQVVVCASKAHAELAAGQQGAASRTIEQAFNRLQAHRQVSVPEASRALALLVRAEVLDSLQDQAGADQARAQADQLVAALRDSEAVRQHHSGVEALPFTHALVRGIALPSQQPTPHWEVSDAMALLSPTQLDSPAEQLSDEEAMRRIDEQREQEARERAVAELKAATERAERDREEAERRARLRAEREAREAAEREVAAQAGVAQEQVEEAEAAEAARREAEAEAAEAARREAEAEAAEAARREAEAEAAEAARREAEAAEAARREAEAAEAARREAEEAARLEQERLRQPVERSRQAVRQAELSGDKHQLVGALESLVEELEPLAQQDPGTHGKELVETLERLSDAQGWWGGRAAGKRAKQLAKQWGL
ncbi:hypothetical protein [Luteococcus sp. OSA5]|uniref:hypothetical protein n=1 Tax=Luteococcus sp. OSA5 TaxID=3401630 RepID=UPI003B435CDB